MSNGDVPQSSRPHNIGFSSQSGRNTQFLGDVAEFVGEEIATADIPETLKKVVLSVGGVAYAFGALYALGEAYDDFNDLMETVAAQRGPIALGVVAASAMIGTAQHFANKAANIPVRNDRDLDLWFAGQALAAQEMWQGKKSPATEDISLNGVHVRNGYHAQWKHFHKYQEAHAASGLRMQMPPPPGGFPPPPGR